MYERTLSGIDEEKWQYAHRLFQCLAFSRHPLRAKELAEVLAVQLDAGGIPNLNVDLRPRDPDEAVLSACSTLVAIVNIRTDSDLGPDRYRFYGYDRQVVQFSHFSVLEFLTSSRLATSRRSLSRYHISPKPAHTILSQSCISTLLTLGDDISKKRIQNFPLAEYAAQNWIHHAQSEGVAPHIQDGMRCLFHPERQNLVAWISNQAVGDPWTRFSIWEPLERQPGPPLYYATLCGLYEVVKHLVITQRQDPNARGGACGTPLHAAMYRGYTGIAQFLLDHGAHIDRRADWDSTLLHGASRWGHLDMARSQLDEGAAVDARDSRGASALHKASQYRNFAIVQLLLDRGASLNIQNNRGLTPFHEVLEYGDLDMAKFLLDHGADVNARDNCGASAFHMTTRFWNCDPTQLLLQYGADVNARDNANSTPLHQASRDSDIGFVRALLDHGADVHARDMQGSMAIHHASLHGHRVTVQLLLQWGADVNAQEGYGRTPLHLASLNGCLDLVQLLIEHGADIDVHDDGGQTAFSIALERRHRKLTRFLSNEDVERYSESSRSYTPRIPPGAEMEQ